MILLSGEVCSSAITHPGKVQCCFVYLLRYNVCVVRRSLFKCCLCNFFTLGERGGPFRIRPAHYRPCCQPQHRRRLLRSDETHFRQFGHWPSPPQHFHCCAWHECRDWAGSTHRGVQTEQHKDPASVSEDLSSRHKFSADRHNDVVNNPVQKRSNKNS